MRTHSRWEFVPVKHRTECWAPLWIQAHLMRLVHLRGNKTLAANKTPAANESQQALLQDVKQERLKIFRGVHIFLFWCLSFLFVWQVCAIKPFYTEIKWCVSYVRYDWGFWSTFCSSQAYKNVLMITSDAQAPGWRVLLIISIANLVFVRIMQPSVIFWVRLAPRLPRRCAHMHAHASCGLVLRNVYLVVLAVS